MEILIRDLFKMNRCLLGEGYDKALSYINKIIPLMVLSVDSGTEIGTWTVPDEWIVKDAWVKHNGKKILDYKKEPLSLVVGSIPFKGKITLRELKSHLYISEERPEATPYEYKFYEKDWGFCMPKFKALKKKGDCKACEIVPGYKVEIEGNKDDWVNALPEKGKYEVFIDTEYKPGKMNIGVHTIKGTTTREILLFAHLDHPYQANDNLSGVACLVDMVKKLKKLKSKHTIKLVFCPETIGSIAYCEMADISNVDYMVAVDICGNDNDLLLQKSFDESSILNTWAHLALETVGESYRKGQFRLLLGSDEYPFNDPQVGIPGILFSRFPYDEYHTSDDTPKIIKKEKIEKVQEVILELIRISDTDYIPHRDFAYPLMRSKFGVQAPVKNLNRQLDYFFYSMDGEKTLAELVCSCGLSYKYVYQLCEKLKNEGILSNFSKEGEQKTPEQKL